MGQEDLDRGEITFKELWRRNITFLEDVLAEVQNIDTKGCGMW